MRATMLAVFLAAATAADAQTVTVGAPAPMTGFFSVVGLDGRYPNYPTQEVGQTFRAPDDVYTALTSFSIWATNALNADYGTAATAALQLSIFELSGSNVVGSALSTSDPFTPTSKSFAGEEHTFDVRLNLDPTKLYLALIFSVTPPNGRLEVISAVNIAGPGDLYADGAAVHLQYSAVDPVTNEWRPNTDPPNGALPSVGGDIAFQATFTATPEPGTLALMATGVVGVAGWARRRRRAARDGAALTHG